MDVSFVVPGAFSYFMPHLGSVSGGAEKQAYLLARELSKDSEFRVTLCAPDFGQAPIEKSQGVEIWSSFKAGNPFLGLLKLAQTIKRLQADVYFFHAPSVGTAIGILICKFFRKKVLYFLAHDFECDWKKSLNVLGWPTAGLMKIAMRYADLVVTQSEQQRKSLNLKSKIIPHGIIRSVIESSEAETHQARSFGLWVGRCTRWKRPEVALELARRFPDSKIILVTSKRPGELELFEKISIEARAIPNVELKTDLPNSELQSLYQEARVLLMTSEQEGFPVVMLEAMAKGCPVLSLEVDPDRFLQRYNAGVVTKGNIKEFEREFQNFMTKDEYVEGIGKNGIRCVHENFNLKKNVEDLKRLLRDPLPS